MKGRRADARQKDNITAPQSRGCSAHDRREPGPIPSSSRLGKRRWIFVGRLFTTEILNCCGSEVILEPTHHRFFVTQNILARCTRLAVSGSCGRGN